MANKKNHKSGGTSKKTHTKDTSHFPGNRSDKKSGAAQTNGQFEQDPKRRLGNFGSAGEHPLTKNK